MQQLLTDARPEDIADEASIQSYLDASPEAWTHGEFLRVEVQLADQTIIFDAGSGIRGLSDALFDDGRGVDHQSA